MMASGGDNGAALSADGAPGKHERRDEGEHVEAGGARPMPCADRSTGFAKLERGTYCHELHHTAAKRRTWNIRSLDILELDGCTSNGDRAGTKCKIEAVLNSVRQSCSAGG